MLLEPRFFSQLGRVFRVHSKTVCRSRRLPGTSWNGIRLVLANFPTSNPAGCFSYASKLYMPLRRTNARTDRIAQTGYRLPNLRQSSYFRGTNRHFGNRSRPIAIDRVSEPTWLGNENQLWRSQSTLCAVEEFWPRNPAGSWTLCDRGGKLDRCPFGRRISPRVYPLIEPKRPTEKVAIGRF